MKLLLVSTCRCVVRYKFSGIGEWTGPWSERAWEWDSLNERDKELLSGRVRNEGELW